MKSATYIVEMTSQKNEKYRYLGEIQLLGRLLASLSSCQLRNFLRVFTEKCFAVFDLSGCVIYLTWYWPLLFFWEFSSIILFMV